MKRKFESLATLYKSTLLDNVLPFWMNRSPDAQHGGYFTCLDRKGEVYDTDKFVWLQCRQVWTFSMLYNRLEKRADWLSTARGGAEFLRKFGMDAAGNWYFSLDRTGRPLVQPYNIFSDCFAAMAMSQYALAAGDESARDLAGATFRNILRRKANPKGAYNKTVPTTRPMVSLSLPMILANLALELEWMLNGDELQSALDLCVREVTGLFLDKERGLLFESVAPDGRHVDCFEGRVINPGHGIEAMWFLMDIAKRTDDRRLIDLCVQVVLNILEFGWDKEYGGIYYFLDAQGKPPQQLEWDQKLWWVHAETLVALAKAYALTGEGRCLEWYDRVHEYAWSRFADRQHPEWFGYLNRRGEVLLELKGGKWKGCFHVPRAMYLCYREFESLAAR